MCYAVSNDISIAPTDGVVVVMPLLASTLSPSLVFVLVLLGIVQPLPHQRPSSSYDRDDRRTLDALPNGLRWTRVESRHLSTRPGRRLRDGRLGEGWGVSRGGA